MRKSLRCILALLMVAIMVIPFSALTGSAAFSSSKTSSHTVATGVTFAKYSVTSGVNGNNCNAYTLTFNPLSSDYIIMPFAGYAGTSANLLTQYNIATGASGTRYNYEVAGVINGGYFSMSNPYGLLTGINVSGGKLESAHLPFADECIAFGSDGSINPVYTNLSNTVELNGKSYKNLLWYVNKRRSSTTASDWSIYDTLFYYDKSCGTKCDTYFSGTEVLCNKLDNTDISIGHTLVGEVVSVTTGTYGGTVGENQFILYYPDTSTGYTTVIKSLKPGDPVKITVTEENSEAKYITENCVGMINNIGWLVKDGNDLTASSNVNIGGHYVASTVSSWTAFGWKNDGTVIYIVSDGYTSNGITMRDIASQMIKLGCTYVVRLDGGGSAAMYLSNTGSGSAGYAYNQSRAVGDCMLVLKRTSAASSSLKAALYEKIQATSAFASIVPDVISKATSIYNSAKSTSGDYKHAIMLLKENASPEGILQQCLTKALNCDADDYSDYASDLVEAYYLEGKRLLADGGTDEEYISVASTIENLLNNAPAGNRVSLGASYATGTVNSAYPDTGACELTDGSLFGIYPTDSDWTGFQSNKKVGTDSYGSYTEIYLDLGTKKTANAVSLSACNYNSWAIYAPSRVALYASDNGTDFYPVGTLNANAAPINSTSPQILLYTLDNISDVSARYYLIRPYFSGSHMFIGEASVYSNTPASGTYYKTSGVDSFNAFVTTNAVRIFNTGTLEASNANLTWSTSYVCEKSNSGYVVTQIIAPNGSTDYSVTVPEKGFVITFHGASYWSQVSMRTPAVGDICTLTGIDIERTTVYPLAKAAFHPASSNVVLKPAVTTDPIKNEFKDAYTFTDNFILIGRNVNIEDIKNIMTDSRITVENANGAFSGTGTTYTDASGNTYTTYVYGDMTGDGCISAIDYLVLKRTALGTYTPSEAQKLAGQINGKNYTNSYLLVKRHVLGTYTID